MRLSYYRRLRAKPFTARVWQWEVIGLGQLGQKQGLGGPLLQGPGGATLLTGLPEYQLLDSLAVDNEGYVCVATIINGGVTAISPDGKPSNTCRRPIR